MDNNMDIIEPLKTVKEIAKYLGITENWVYIMVRENKIPSKRIGRHIRFSMAEINEWLLKDSNYRDSLN